MIVITGLNETAPSSLISSFTKSPVAEAVLVDPDGELGLVTFALGL
jgi:hypothetical protein